MDAVRHPAIRIGEPVPFTYATELHVLGALLAGRLDPARLDTITVGNGGIPAWTALVALAQRHKAGPLLLAIAIAAGLAVKQDPVWQPLYSARRNAATHYLLAKGVQRTLQQTLSAAGIPVLWLKGIVLASTVYPVPELRPMVDVDALVPYAQRQQALVVAESAGFRRTEPALFDGTEGLKHHYHLCGGPGDAVHVELHFRLLGAVDRLLPVARLTWFWEHTAEHTADGITVKILQPEAHLLYLCAHALMQHGEVDLQLLRFYDLHLLITQTPEFDWNVVVDGASELGWTYAVERALAISTEYFGTPVPQTVNLALQSRRSSADDVAHVARKQQPATLTEIVLGDLAAMGWRDRVRSIVRIVLPPPGYMRWRYKLVSARQLPQAYARRLMYIGRNFVLTVRKRTQRRS